MKSGEYFGAFRPRVIAEFHVLTDYAWRSSPNDPIRFTGWQSCTNPFANLEPPKVA